MEAQRVTNAGAQVRNSANGHAARGRLAAEVAAAHTAALEMMIPAAACLANRTSQAGLVSSNVFGQNFPGIVALDAQYGDFWVTNATARTG